MKYSAELQHYFHHRQHDGRLDLQSPQVYSVQVGNADNHELLVLFVEYSGHICRARFQASGSVALIAGGEYICGWLEANKFRSEWINFTPELLLQALGLSRHSIHVAHLIEMAVRRLNDVIPR